MIKRWFTPRLKTLDSVDAYQLWAHTYPAEAHNAFMQAEQNAMLGMLPNLEGKFVLDLACGTGRYGRIALENGARTIVGLDNSPEMLQRSTINPVALATTDFLPLPNQSIDIVLCGLALGHLPFIDKAISEIGRVLQSDGVALISDLHPYQTLTGAQRTFKTSDGTDYAVEHHLHHISEYFAVGQVNDLIVTDIKEVSVVGQMPAVLIVKFHKEVTQASSSVVSK